MFKQMTLRSKLLIYLLIMSIVPFAVLGLISMLNSGMALKKMAFAQLKGLREVKKAQILNYFNEREQDLTVLLDTVSSLRQAAFDKLNTAQENKKAQIANYFKDAVNDIDVISANATVIDALEDFESVFNDQGKFDSILYDFFEKVKYGNSLYQYKEKYGYYDLLLVTNMGKVVFSLNRESDLGQNVLTGPFKDSGLGRCFKKALKQTDFEDFEQYKPADDQYIAFLGAPIGKTGGNAAGVVILKLNKDAINKIVHRREGMGQTGETYLVSINNGKWFYRSDLIVNSGAFGSEVISPQMDKHFDQDFKYEVKPDKNQDLQITRYDKLNILNLHWLMINSMKLEEVIAPKLGNDDKDYFSRFINAYGYKDVLLITPQGDIFYSVLHGKEYKTNLNSGPYADSGLGKLFHNVLSSKKFYFSDFSPYEPANGNPTAFIGQPLIYNDSVELVVAMRLSIRSIDKVMQERSGMGDTGETYLVGPDHLMRSNSYLDSKRFSVKASFADPENHRIMTIASSNGLSGQTGQKIIKNYSGHQVLSAYTPLHVWDTTWVLIAEVSASEAFISVKVLRYFFILIGVIGVLVVTLVSFWVSKSISGPIKRLTDATYKISAGDLDVDLDPKLADSEKEISVLASSFTTMTHQLKKTMQDLKSEIVERKQIENALRQSESKYKLLAENLPQKVYYKDLHSVYLACNQNFANEFGLTGDEIVGKTDYDFFPKELADIYVASDKDILISGGPQSIEQPYIKDGQKYVIQAVKTPVYDDQDNRAGILGIFWDITEQKQAEENLKLFRKLIDHSNDAIFVIEPQSSRYLDVNDTACVKLGYTREELLNMSVIDIDENLTDLAAWHTHMANAKKQANPLRSTYHKRKDGRSFPVELNTTFITYRGKEYRMAVARDLTERRSLESQLKQAHKMEAIGTIAGGIAHDFNNILGIILGNTELALFALEKPSAIVENLEEVKNASLRASAVVKQLLNFSRKSEEQHKPIKIHKIIKESLKLIRASIPSTISIQSTIPDDIGTIMADATQIHQVLINLCTNASHAMDSIGGILDVGLGEVVLEQTAAQKYYELKPGKYVQLTVSDTGHGIDRTIVDRIFDPYFTTKEVGKGTGMGLAVVHGIIKNHNGAIGVYSEPQKGSTFKVLFPAIDVQPVDDTPITHDLPKGSESILLIDDEMTLLRIGKELLEKLGYKVDIDIDPTKALERIRLNPNKYDLVITDMTMPQMTGVQLTQKILTIRSDMPVILCTGFSEKINGEKAKVLGVRRYVEKPIDIFALSLNVREVLDGK